MGASFLTGLLQGNVDTAGKMRKGGKKGLLRQGKKGMPGTKSVSTSAQESDDEIPEYKRGGKVKRTGLARVHKGERVLTKRQAKRMGKGR
jgi:hypothetical protein